MDNKIYKKRLLTLILLVVAGLFLSSLSAYILAYINSGFNLKNLPQGINKIKESKDMLSLIQTIQSFFLFIIPSILLPFLWKEKITDFLSLNKTKVINFFIAIFSIISSIPLINFLSLWNSQLHLPSFMHGIEQWMINSENSAKIMTERMLTANSISEIIISFFIVAFLAAIGEEFFFRGLLQKMVQNRFNSHMLSIWVVAIIFSTFHLQFFGFFPRLLLGAWFGYLLIKTHSLWIPITAHFFNNAIAIIAFHLENSSLQELDIQNNINSKVLEANSISTIGTESSTMLCVLSMLSILFCVWALNRYNE